MQGEEAPGQALRLSYNILQAAGSRIFKTDYVACPSCGRTLFNLQTTTAKIKAATSHLKGVKIAIMGCIVNGPGEMADADFGYVGGAPGKVNLYVGKTAVKFNIPEAEAVDRLQDLIREHGKWVEPASVAHALGTDQLIVEHVSTTIVAPGRIGPFVAAPVFLAVQEEAAGCRVELRDAGREDRLVATTFVRMRVCR